jgi:cytochrome c-type biogenesis protein CcmH
MTAPSKARLAALIGALAAFALLLAGIGQMLVGGPAQAAASNPRPAPEALYFGRGDDALAQAESRVSALIDRLAERLHAQPSDADGWHTLARAYASLGRHAAAIEAFRRALRLRPHEATLLAEQAASIAALGGSAPTSASSTSTSLPPR